MQEKLLLERLVGVAGAEAAVFVHAREDLTSWEVMTPRLVTASLK
jgi:hypothetical protein